MTLQSFLYRRRSRPLARKHNSSTSTGRHCVPCRSHENTAKRAITLLSVAQEGPGTSTTVALVEFQTLQYAVVPLSRVDHFVPVHTAG
jgi:hypothetical protein